MTLRRMRAFQSSDWLLIQSLGKELSVLQKLCRASRRIWSKPSKDMSILEPSRNKIKKPPHPIKIYSVHHCSYRKRASKREERVSNKKFKMILTLLSKLKDCELQNFINQVTPRIERNQRDTRFKISKSQILNFRAMENLLKIHHSVISARKLPKIKLMKLSIKRGFLKVGTSNHASFQSDHLDATEDCNRSILPDLSQKELCIDNSLNLDPCIENKSSLVVAPARLTYRHLTQKSRSEMVQKELDLLKRHEDLQAKVYPEFGDSCVSDIELTKPHRFLYTEEFLVAFYKNCLMDIPGSAMIWIHLKKTKDLRIFFSHNFPRKCNSLVIDRLESGHISLDHLLPQISRISPRLSVEICFMHFYINEKQLKRILAASRHVEILEISWCELHIPRVPDLSHGLKGATMEKIKLLHCRFSGCSNAWTKSKELKNLIKGLATSSDFKQSLGEFHFDGSEFGKDFEEIFEERFINSFAKQFGKDLGAKFTAEFGEKFMD
ncbi:unnamed protein product [Moneuplotes crassus]|uniref:Uncharacterized protein n=1 Tax=Euplotes crassus TaxID=5936 RepID=A0AAD2DCK2_EUPCR|nr:unnamed protein product [Moneuplotes crassus]